MSELRVRPSARIIKTIGKDLIKDKFAAVVELVKNSYDADSNKTEITFEYNKISKNLSICIFDNGHGMTEETIINSWLVPATNDKLHRKTSPKGRPLQGRKGIGRFAATILGNQIKVDTKTSNQPASLIKLDLNLFVDEKLLDEIPIFLTQGSRKTTGTTIEIITEDVSEQEVLSVWNEKQRSELFIELSKLLAPTEVIKKGTTLGYSESPDVFEIIVNYKNFSLIKNERIEIKAFPLIDLYDYRIHGSIDNKGKASLFYSNQNTPSIPEEYITKDFNLEDSILQSYPGSISFDIRVFDRDPESIDQLIDRGLRDPFSNEKVGKIKAKEILNAYYGVSLFRGKFRIRPYGNRDFDWLELDKKRVQNPSLKIGHNQAIGFISIQSEEHSKLEEKSARDGLVENSQYVGLQYLIACAMSQLEERRFNFREKTLRGRNKDSVTGKIDELFNFDDIKSAIQKEINKLDIKNNEKIKVKNVIEKEIKKQEKNRKKDYESIKEKLALYKGQATLGKITHVVLHEGRKHLKVINEVPPRIAKWAKSISQEYNQETYLKLVDRSNLLIDSSKAMSYLFKKLEPLAISKLPARKEINLNNEIKNCLTIFSQELINEKIDVEMKIPSDLFLRATSFDIATIFSNLIENSIYWLKLSPNFKKIIEIEVTVNNNTIEIVFSDNGPGLQGSSIDYIFEPGYSMKPEGTGLGLALVGESVSRLDGAIKAIKSPNGAIFEITFDKE